MRKYRPLKNVIFKNALLMCICALVVIAVVINTALPHFFYKTQQAVSCDISSCVNDNLSAVLQDLDYIYSEVSNNEELLSAIMKAKQAYRYGDYAVIKEGFGEVNSTFADMIFCYRNLLEKIIITQRDEPVFESNVNAWGYIDKIKSFDSPQFYSIQMNNEERYVLFRPLYDTKGGYVCDISFIIGKDKSKMISEQTGFAIIENNGSIMMSNMPEIYESKAFSRFIQGHKNEDEFVGMQKIGDKMFFIASSAFENYAWRLYIILPNDNFYNCMRRIALINIAVFLITIVLAYGYINAFSSMIGSEISDAVYEIDNFLNKSGNKRKNKNSRVVRFLRRVFNGKSVYYKFLGFNITAVLAPALIVLMVSGIYYMYNINYEYKRIAGTLADMNRLKAENTFDKYNNAMDVILVYEDVRNNIYNYEREYKKTGLLNNENPYYDEINAELEKIYKYSGNFRFIYQNANKDIILKWPAYYIGDYDTAAFSNKFETTFDSVHKNYVCSITKRISLLTSEYYGSSGYGTLQFDSSQITDNIYAPDSNAYFYITDRNDTIASTIDSKGIGRKIAFQNENIYITRPVEEYNTVLVMRCSKEPIRNVYIIIGFLFLALFGLLSVSVMINAHKMSRYIIEPVEATEKAICTKEVEYIAYKRKSRDEFDELITHVNEMKARIEKLIDRIYKQEIISKDLQMEALRAQITPHFLYNVFEIVNAMVDLNDSRVSKLIILISDFFRQGISRSEGAITLNEEIKYLNVYLDIQKFIYEERLNIKTDIDDACLNSMVIRFIIQPVFENIFKHGAFKKSDKIDISMKVYKLQRAGKIRICVSDNGSGMSKEELSRLKEYINGEKNGFSGVGLKNVNERLILHYGKEYAMKLYSKENKGFTVVITIPYNEQTAM